ncbi:MAG: hypothetical protein ABW199_07180 [Caulobacterales bacterium]
MIKHVTWAGLRAFAFATVILLAACALTSVKTGAYTPSNSSYEVTLSGGWSDISQLMRARSPRVKLLSIDGPLLNRLYLAYALRPGDYMLRPDNRETPTPLYRADMADTELVEFIADNVSALGYLRPETSNLRPQNFGAGPGVRFDITARTSEGLDISGTALVSRQGETLNAMLYLAPSEHYYAAHLADVENIFTSARLR